MQSTALLQGDACFENLQALDRELARVARSSGSLHFAIGLGLDALARSGGYGALGFTSIDDYGQERCDLGSTAIRRACRLARRSSELPRLKAALFSGRISWSMALELAAFATPQNEEPLLALAAHSTVSRMKDLLKAQQRRPLETRAETDPGSLCTLTITEDHEDALLFECAHRLARHLGANTMSDVVDALIGEATTSLLPLLPKDAADPNDLAPSLDAQNAYIRQRSQWRAEAERRCESRIPAWPSDVEPPDVPMDFTGTPESIDASLRRSPRSCRGATPSSATSPNASGKPAAGAVSVTPRTSNTLASASECASPPSRTNASWPGSSVNCRASAAPFTSTTSATKPRASSHASPPL
jgi:hypothetical protein